MSAILIAILAVAAISIALYPLYELERRPSRAEVTIDPNLENVLSAREATYSAIKDLETDHAMGKLSGADYDTLRAKYEGKALAILRQLDAMQPNVPQTTPASARAGNCAECGTPIVTGAKFCRHCGASLAATPLAPPCHPTGPEWGPREGQVCASCGAPVAADSKFCRRCGSPVSLLQPA